MRTIVRLFVSLALAGGLVAACAAAAAPTTAPTPAPPAAPPAATPALAPTATTAPAPTPTPIRSVEPMAPAYVTGTGTAAQTAKGTTTQAGEIVHVSGIVVEGSETMNDPRVSGTFTFQLIGVGSNEVGFEWGPMRLENANGAWEGTCSGGIWDNENASDVSCWLVGSGAYKGLTYYHHVRSAGIGGEITGVILPVPAPKP